MQPSADMIEAGAMAIYAAFIRSTDPDVIDKRWNRCADRTRREFRNEARECIRAAMEVSRHE